MIIIQHYIKLCIHMSHSFFLSFFLLAAVVLYGLLSLFLSALISLFLSPFFHTPSGVSAASLFCVSLLLSHA